MSVENEKRNQSLYQFTSELKTIEELLEREDSDALFERQNELANLITEKTDSIVYFNQSQEDYLELIDKRLKELQELKKKIIARQERFESYVLGCLDMLGVEKIKGKLASITIRKPRQVVEVYDESLLPPDFFRTKMIVEVDKIKLKEALENNEEIQGAKMSLGKKSISMKLGL